VRGFGGGGVGLAEIQLLDPAGAQEIGDEIEQR